MATAQQISDEIRSRLDDLDGSDVDVTSWEADFIESVAFGEYDGPLTERQVEAARNILSKYGF